MLYLTVAAVLFFALTVFLSVKIIVMRRAVEQIRQGIVEIIDGDTNTIISVPYVDKTITNLAAAVNVELKKLRDERLRCRTGDLELKEAVANISHDLRTPLTAVKGYLNLLEKQIRESSEEFEIRPDILRSVAIIQGRVDNLSELTEEFFCYSYLNQPSEELHCDVISLKGAIEEILVSYYAAFREKQIEPQITLPDGDVRIFADKNALSRIFSNIISNTLKYSAPYKMSGTSASGDFCVNLDENGAVTLSNAVCGMDETQVGRLFDRFYTVNSARKSTGLGMSIAKILTGRMRGKIGAELEDGRLIIRLSFPMLR